MGFHTLEGGRVLYQKVSGIRCSYQHKYNIILKLKSVLVNFLVRQKKSAELQNIDPISRSFIFFKILTS